MPKKKKILNVDYYRIWYGRGRWKKRVTIPIEDVPKDKIRPEKCPCCGLAHVKKWEFHHWLYKYKVKEVVAKPYLALENGQWMCYSCHKFFADHWRNIIEKTKKFPGRGLGVFRHIPLDMKVALELYFVEMIKG